MRPYNKTPRFWMTFFTLALVSTLLTACFGGGSGGEGEEIPEAAPTPVVKTVCTETCRLRGQCGDNTDGQIFVLGQENQPATRNQTQLFPQDAIVNRLAVQDKVVRFPETNAEETWSFAQVQIADGGQTGWVAGVCLVEQ